MEPTTDFIQGEVVSCLDVYDHIGAAIMGVSVAAQDQDGVTLLILQAHLKALCNMQLNAFDDRLKEVDGNAPI